MTNRTKVADNPVSETADQRTARIVAWLRGTFCQQRTHPEDQAFARIHLRNNALAMCDEIDRLRAALQEPGNPSAWSTLPVEWLALSEQPASLTNPITGENDG